MARVLFKEGSGIAGISGRAGNLIFSVTATGETYVRQAPTPTKRPGTAAQKQWRKGTFKEAVAYGKAQQTSAGGRAYYQPFVKPGSFNSVYNQALADYTKPPEVRAVEVAGYQGQAGELLRVEAHDPFGVVAVRVQVLSEAGQVLEEGSAQTQSSDWWHYRTILTHSLGMACQVRVLAYDRPGNEATLTIEL